MSRAKNTILWSVIGLLVTLIAGTLLILVHPGLLTGHYYEFTVKQVKVDEYGYVIFFYDDVLSYKTDVTWRFGEGSTRMETDTWEMRSEGFLRRPVKSHDRSIGLAMAPGARFLLKEGTYRIRAGETLEIMTWTTPEGATRTSTVSVEQAP